MAPRSPNFFYAKSPRTRILALCSTNTSQTASNTHAHSTPEQDSSRCRFSHRPGLAPVACSSVFGVNSSCAPAAPLPCRLQAGLAMPPLRSRPDAGLRCRAVIAQCRVAPAVVLIFVLLMCAHVACACGSPRSEARPSDGRTQFRPFAALRQVRRCSTATTCLCGRIRYARWVSARVTVVPQARTDGRTTRSTALPVVAMRCAALGSRPASRETRCRQRERVARRLTPQ